MSVEKQGNNHTRGVAPRLESNEIKRLAIETAKYLDLKEGDPLPIEELEEQARANGYDSDELRAMLRTEGLDSAQAVTVPEQGQLLGPLWAHHSGESDGLDDTGDGSKSSKACSPSPELGEEPEPLDESADFLALQEPIALDAGDVHPEYLNDAGEPLTATEAVSRYIKERHGENTSAERHGFHKTLHWRDRRNYAQGMCMDRQMLARDDPTIAMLSLRVERSVEQRVTLLKELSEAMDSVRDALDYQLRTKRGISFEWFAVFAGTRQYATPHIHIVVYLDEDVTRAPFEGVVNTFIESCEFAPSSGRGNSPEGGAITLRGTAETDPIPITDSGNSAAAVYVLTQLAHLGEVDDMNHDKLLHAATIRATEGTHHFRKSSYTVWPDEEPEPSEIRDSGPETVLSEVAVTDSLDTEVSHGLDTLGAAEATDSADRQSALREGEATDSAADNAGGGSESIEDSRSTSDESRSPSDESEGDASATASIDRFDFAEDTGDRPKSPDFDFLDPSEESPFDLAAG